MITRVMFCLFSISTPDALSGHEFAECTNSCVRSIFCPCRYNPDLFTHILGHMFRSFPSFSNGLMQSKAVVAYYGRGCVCQDRLKVGYITAALFSHGRSVKRGKIE